MSENSPALKFLEQLRQTIREKGGTTAVRSGTERVEMNRAAVALLAEALASFDPMTAGHFELPAVVMLGQPGHVGYVDGVKVRYEPLLDTETEPVARYVVKT